MFFLQHSRVHTFDELPRTLLCLPSGLLNSMQADLRCKSDIDKIFEETKYAPCWHQLPCIMSLNLKGC